MDQHSVVRHHSAAGGGEGGRGGSSGARARGNLPLSISSSGSTPSTMAGVPLGRAPAYTVDMEFDGQLEGGQRRCECNQLPARRVCSEGPDAGRRFYGCFHNRCPYTDWVDGPWPPVLQRYLTGLWFNSQPPDEFATEFAAKCDALVLHEMVDDATEELNEEMREMETRHARALRALGRQHAQVIRTLEAKHAKDLQSTTPRLRKKQRKQTDPSGKEVGPDIWSMNTRTQGLQEVASIRENKYSAELGSSSENYAPTSTADPMLRIEHSAAKGMQDVVRHHPARGGGGCSSGVRLVGTVEVDTDWFWCPVCGHLIYGPPIFQCKTGHLACDRCHAKQCLRCDGSFDTRSKVMEDLISASKFACPHKGCNGVFTYPDLIEHREDCHINPPCYCTEAGCTYAAPADDLLLHLHRAHSWPVHRVAYGKNLRLRVPLSEPRHLFLGVEDTRLFALVVAEQGANVAISLVCVRPEDGEARYKAMLGATVATGITFEKTFMTVVCSDRPGAVAVDNLLTVPLTDILAGDDGASKEFYLKFRIEKISRN